MGNTTFPLLFEVFKPKERLKEADEHHTKPEIAVKLLQQLQEEGFQFDLVLADSLYEKSSIVIRELQGMGVDFTVAIRSNHGV